MDQESQCRTKSDDTGYGNDLLPVSDNNGLKDLTAQLEFQPYSKPLRQGDLHIRHPPHIIIKPFQTGENNNDRLAAPLVRGDKDTVEQIPESQRAQLVFGEDPLGIGQEVEPTAFCMELLQCADRGGIAL